MSALLELENVTMQFGGVVAVNDLSLHVDQGEIIALIGPNGAGKTSAFNCITGVYEPTNGRISFDGKTIIVNHPSGKMKRTYAGNKAVLFSSEKTIDPTPDEITKLGIARTFQNIRLFRSMNVFDNVLTAMHLRAKANIFASVLRLDYKEERAMRAETEKLLKEQGLWEHRYEKAVSLPYGFQRRLEIARALASEPKLLFLDEPAAGMNPAETAHLMDVVDKIRSLGVTVVLIEHDMKLVMNICDQITVLNFGTKIAEGTPQAIKQNKDVIEAYLGKEEE